MNKNKIFKVNVLGNFRQVGDPTLVWKKTLSKIADQNSLIKYLINFQGHHTFSPSGKTAPVEGPSTLGLGVLGR